MDWKEPAFWQKYGHMTGHELSRAFGMTGRTWRERKQDATDKWPECFCVAPLPEPDSIPAADRVALPDDKLHKTYSKPATELVFALIGDTHANSQEEKLEELHAFYDICVDEGVKDVYHTGDIDAGEGVYPGQQFELACVGMDNHLAHVEAHYPKRGGITTRFITGNHDFSYYKRMGVDIGTLIESRRPDMHYLGKYGAYVELAPGCQLYLMHPDGGVAYSLSYKRQRIVEGFLGGTKPQIFASGHDHQAMHFTYRNVEIFGTGCFEGQTPFLKRKGIQPQIGGYIVSLKLDAGGAVRRCKSEYIKFYEGY